MPKTIIEVLPSPYETSQLPVKRSDLAAEVQRQVAEILQARDEFVFEPWFRSRQVAYELKRLQTVSEQRTWTIYYERFGCLICQTLLRPHGGRGFCTQCYALTLSRLKQIRGEQIREEVAQPARGRLRLDRMLPAGKAYDGTHHTRYEHSTAKELELFARVAKQLGLTPTHVRRVAVGSLRSEAVAEALRKEAAAELGVRPQDAATTRRAVKEALLALIPEAKSASQLFLGLSVSDSLAKIALRELFAEGKVQRFATGLKGNMYRYRYFT